ncbi:hypothetical protein Msil_0459 [Methylocella silvestris BL2]|uniref:Oligosaccharide repeat unit polymerase n=1 Tax=Methylocella silvestris (strain DSM 15510 / CIP 108128 / LMG 27833 / NCIMB 13906 / BL2) TaxID=395965 RepID=B8EJM9_METSB|nr:hypothetical protein [Methylocella silvestris]ACK49433.1 hypothetical protein Msil_0459 [Methylocella silvestris BL2]
MQEEYRIFPFQMALVLFSCIVSALFFLFILPYNAQYNDSLVILAFCISALFLMLITNLCDPRPRPIHLLFCIYMIFFYLLPGYFHTAYARFPFFQAGYSPAQVLTASMVVATFLAFFLIGYGIVLFPRGKRARRAIVPGRLQRAAIFCLITGIVCAGSLGFSGFMTTIRDSNLTTQTTGETATPIKLIIGALARATSFYGFMYGIFLLRDDRRLINALVCLSTTALFFTLNSPLAVTRFVIGSYVIGVFIVLVQFNRPQKLMLAFAFIGAQAGLFSYISYLSRGDLGTAYVWAPLDDFTTSGDFDGFQSTINVTSYHDQLGGKHGVNLASALLFFVPRPLWPQKSGGTGGEAAIFEGYPMWNISSPLPSEFYIDFGFPGVVVLSFIFGMLIRLGDDYFLHFKNTADALGQVLVATVASYIFIILRGALVAILGPFAVSLAIATLCHAYVTAPVKEDEDDESDV